MAAPTTRAGQKGQVLLVDDEAELLAVLGRALRSRGHDVETVGDARTALEMIGSGKPYDVLVSDISMPEMDGIQLLRGVRERNVDLPVVLMTGSPSIETAVRAVELGALRYLTKPFRAEDLEGVVEYAVRLHRLAAVKREAMALLGHTQIAGDLVGLDAAFTQALGSLWMAFQPIVSWNAKKLFGYEALVRCPHPQLPHPGALLAAAERLERIHEIGRVIRGRVAETVAATPDIDNVFVNLHSHDLLDEQLFQPDAPLSRLAKRVVLEITERASLDEVKDLRARTAKLRALGFRLAVDDLGAGYAGLTSFAQLEPEVVKLDMSLVRNVHAEPTKKKLITSMVGLCRDLGMQVLAEGVETVEERDALAALGCDLLQGYLFGKPVREFASVAF